MLRLRVHLTHLNSYSSICELGTVPSSGMQLVQVTELQVSQTTKPSPPSQQRWHHWQKRQRVDRRSLGSWSLTSSPLPASDGTSPAPVLGSTSAISTSGVSDGERDMPREPDAWERIPVEGTSSLFANPPVDFFAVCFVFGISGGRLIVGG